MPVGSENETVFEILKTIKLFIDLFTSSVAPKWSDHLLLASVKSFKPLEDAEKEGRKKKVECVRYDKSFIRPKFFYFKLLIIKSKNTC